MYLIKSSVEAQLKHSINNQDIDRGRLRQEKLPAQMDQGIWKGNS